jgi:hypothetical protein
MPTINQLSSLSQLSSGDQFPVYNTANNDARRVSVNALLTYFQQQFASPSVATNVYVPTTGFSLAVPTPVAEQQWMLLQPASTLATGTITLPLNTTTADGTEVMITTTQEITALTISLNGAAAAFGTTPRLQAGAALRLRFHLATNSWYAIADSGNQLITGAGKLGYAAGSGGTVAQGSGSGKATGVTLSRSNGSITLDAANLNAATTVSFTLTNTVIEAGDILVMNHLSGGTAGAYMLNAQCSAGSASINVRNVTAGNLAEAIVIRFAVIKAVSV